MGKEVKMMAEFQEVMKEWRRMCGKMREQGDWCHADQCPLGGICQIPSTTDTATVEGIVMAWAIENPEPVYPTWTEYFRMIGVFPSWSGHEILDKTHIPAETAKKLGVEPKEG